MTAYTVFSAIMPIFMTLFVLSLSVASFVKGWTKIGFIQLGLTVCMTVCASINLTDLINKILSR